MSTHCYRITIDGVLGEIGREAFADFLIEPDGGTTVLTGELDQAALYGALNRVLSLGLELVELSRVTEGRALTYSGGACLTSTSSRPSARIRSSNSCRSP